MVSKISNREWNESDIQKVLEGLANPPAARATWIRRDLTLKNPNLAQRALWKVAKHSAFLRRLFFSVDYQASHDHLEKIKAKVLLNDSPQIPLYNRAIQTFNSFVPKTYVLSSLDESLPTSTPLPKAEEVKTPPTQKNYYFDVLQKFKEQYIPLDPIPTNGNWEINLFREQAICFKKNIPAFLRFLEETPHHSEIAFTIGFGGRARSKQETRTDQFWPEPLLHALNQNKSIMNVLIDTHGQSCAPSDLTAMLLDRAGPKSPASFWQNLAQNVDIPQFSCGIPSEEDLKEKENLSSAQKEVSCSWESQQQIDEFRQKWCDFNLRCLEAGKKVYIGWYVNSRPDPWIINFYNAHQEKYQNQLFFLVGSQDFGCIPKGQYSQEEINKARDFYDAQDDEHLSAYSDRYTFVENGRF